MKLSRNYALKIIKALKSSNKDIFTCEDLAKEIGVDYDIVIDWIEEFYSMIRIDTGFNLRELSIDFESYVDYLEGLTANNYDVAFDPEEEKYNDFIEYVLKNMTIGGGVIDRNYKLTEKDKRILRKLIDKK